MLLGFVILIVIYNKFLYIIPMPANPAPIRFTRRQRENLGKAFLSAANAILAVWVFSNVLGQAFRLPILLFGVIIYIGLLWAVLWVDR